MSAWSQFLVVFYLSFRVIAKVHVRFKIKNFCIKIVIKITSSPSKQFKNVFLHCKLLPHLCLPDFAWRMVVLHNFDLKQLLDNLAFDGDCLQNVWMMWKAFIVFSWKILNCFINKVFFFKNVCIYIEIQADSNLCKCLKAIQCSESRVQTLQIFYDNVLCFHIYQTLVFLWVTITLFSGRIRKKI